MAVPESLQGGRDWVQPQEVDTTSALISTADHGEQRPDTGGPVESNFATSRSDASQQWERFRLMQASRRFRSNRTGLGVLNTYESREGAIGSLCTSLFIALLLGAMLALAAWYDRRIGLGHGWVEVYLHFWWVVSLGSALPVIARTGWGWVSVAFLAMPVFLAAPAIVWGGSPSGVAGATLAVALWSPLWCWAGIVVNAMVRLRKTSGRHPGTAP